MRFRESLTIALRSLRANKLRSGLTMLGIVIGVASLVAMIAVGSGAQTQISEQIRTLGANVLMILPGAKRQGGGATFTLTESDSEAISRQVPFACWAAWSAFSSASASASASVSASVFRWLGRRSPDGRYSYRWKPCSPPWDSRRPSGFF
jgi:putative ABC transport system permease protein